MSSIEEQLHQEAAIDRLLERPGRQYTDVSELVSDLQVERRRGFEDARANANEEASSKQCDDDECDEHDEHAHEHAAVDDDDESGGKRSFQRAFAPASEQRVTSAIHGKGPQTGPKARLRDWTQALCECLM